MFKNVACVKGDRVAFTYDDPHKAVKQQRTGVVEVVGSGHICIRDEAHNNSFRSFSAAFVSDFRVVSRTQG